MSQLKESQHLKIPFEEIVSGTNNFQDCIGKGGFGMVYKGQLFISRKSTTVAVKRLKEQHHGQGLKEFLTEIQLLTGQIHPNLITLLGYCDDGKEKIIVYEYAEHGSLDKYLGRSTKTGTTLTWFEKLKICVGAARGLDYLHNHVGQHETVIHRDVKSSNILIDENWVAKISDLGLSKLCLAGLNRSTVITYACGTQGYMEPEYINTGIVKKESDVYSFGMVLFEVLCGRLCCIPDNDGFTLSGPLAKDYYEKNKLGEIVDPGLKEQMNTDSMNIFSAIAYQCLHDDRGQRPSMDIVLKELEESLDIQENQLHISTEINPNEVVDRSRVDLQSSFDMTTQTQPNNEIHVEVVEARALSFGSLYQKMVKETLNSKKDIWKNQQLLELVEEYFEKSKQTSDFCAALEKCLRRVQDIRMLAVVALQHFVERRYVKTLKNLKDFKAVVDPFTEDFLKIIAFDCRQQDELVDKLQREKQMLDEKVKQIRSRRKVRNVIFVVMYVAFMGIAFMVRLIAVSVPSIVLTFTFVAIGLLMHSASTKNVNATKEKKEIIKSMHEGVVAGINDLGTIRVHANNAKIDIGELSEKVEDAIKGDVLVVKRGSGIMEDIKKNLDLFVKNVESLEKAASTYNHQIQSAGTVILDRIKSSIK